VAYIKVRILICKLIFWVSDRQTVNDVMYGMVVAGLSRYFWENHGKCNLLLTSDVKCDIFFDLCLIVMYVNCEDTFTFFVSSSQFFI
jgi:hypothetical protein